MGLWANWRYGKNRSQWKRENSALIDVIAIAQQR